MGGVSECDKTGKLGHHLINTRRAVMPLKGEVFCFVGEWTSCSGLHEKGDGLVKRRHECQAIIIIHKPLARVLKP